MAKGLGQLPTHKRLVWYHPTLPYHPPYPHTTPLSPQYPEIKLINKFHTQSSVNVAQLGWSSLYKLQCGHFKKQEEVSNLCWSLQLDVSSTWVNDKVREVLTCSSLVPSRPSSLCPWYRYCMIHTRLDWSMWAMTVWDSEASLLQMLQIKTWKLLAGKIKKVTFSKMWKNRSSKIENVLPSPSTQNYSPAWNEKQSHRDN